MNPHQRRSGTHVEQLCHKRNTKMDCMEMWLVMPRALIWVFDVAPSNGSNMVLSCFLHVQNNHKVPTCRGSQRPPGATPLPCTLTWCRELVWLRRDIENESRESDSRYGILSVDGIPTCCLNVTVGSTSFIYYTLANVVEFLILRCSDCKLTNCLIVLRGQTQICVISYMDV